MDIPIIFEDSEIVVLDKPAGIVCNRAETVATETLQDWYAKRYNSPVMSNQAKYVPEDEIDYKQYFAERLGLVHRLDRETSGVMVMAKTVEAFKSLLKQFKEHSVKKEYVALTHGFWKAREGEISLPIARRRDDRKKFGVRADGRESITSYNVLSEYTHWEFPKELKVDDRGYIGFSLVQFKPKTGRTHQIRVHAQQMGHPIVGDFDYAGRKRNREDRKWCNRVMLQAQKIEFEHPRNGKRIHFESNGEELNKVLNFLRISEDHKLGG